jgi:Ca-activated chloride channel family protein
MVCQSDFNRTAARQRAARVAIVAAGSRSMTAQFQFGQPLFLLLAVCLPALWLGWRRLSHTIILWRSVVLLALILALADPESIERARIDGNGRVFAFDLSRSVPAEMRLWMARQNLVPRTGDRVFVFGGAAEEVKDWQRMLRGATSIERMAPERTNLEALFSKLLQRARTGESVFLFTDGWETEGSIERLLPSLAQAGIKVYPVLPAEQPTAANVAVKKVVAPSQGTKGESVNVKVLVENNDRKEVDGNLVLKSGGQPVKSEAVRIKPGSQLFNYRMAVDGGPLQSFQAEFIPRRADADLVREDNRATAWIGVQSKEKVLLLDGRSGEGKYLAELLKRRGFEVASVVAGGAPPALAEYGIVILNNVEKEQFPPAFLSAIEAHVNAGNGLLVLGDESSLGPPGYRQTPIGAALPVEPLDPKQPDKEKTRAVLLVIDKSRSMHPSRNPFKEDRIPYAKEIAKRVIADLTDDDFIGVIGFDSKPFTVVPLDSVKKLRPTFAGQIDRLVADGATEVLLALQEAARQLRKQSADRKYLILLTDADRIEGSPSQYIDFVTYMKNEDKINVSVVGIGRGVDEAFVKRIATYGGGVYHIADDLSKLPELVFKHIAQKPPETPPQPKDFVPVAARGSEIVASLPERSFPAVKGYVASELKKGARLDLMMPDGKNSPLLASWKYGKGKAAALTIDLAARWSKDWISWGGLERFWGRVFDWLRPEREGLPPHEARINLAGARPVLDFYLYGAESDGNSFRYSYSGAGNGDGALKRLAPGHYQAELPLSAPGDYRIELKEERCGQLVAYPPLGYTLAAPPVGEIFRGEFNLPLLERIARSTGGTINPGPDLEDKGVETLTKVTPLRPYFILVSALLFLSEIFFRRFVHT